MIRLTPEEAAEQDLRRWRQGGLLPGTSPAGDRAFPVPVGRQGTQAPAFRAVGAPGLAEARGFVPAAQPWGAGARPGAPEERAGNLIRPDHDPGLPESGRWAASASLPGRDSVQLAAYQPPGGKRQLAGTAPMLSPKGTPATKTPVTGPAPVPGGEKESRPPVFSPEVRAQLQEIDREIAEVEALSAWHHDRIRDNRAQQTPIPDRDPRTRQHLYQIQQVLNPRVLALRAKREQLAGSPRSGGSPGRQEAPGLQTGRPGGVPVEDSIDRYSDVLPPKVTVTRYVPQGTGAPGAPVKEQVQPPSERQTRVLGGGKYPVYDPFHSREARDKNLVEHALDLPLHLFGGTFLEEKEKTARVYHAAQLQGLIPPAPLLAGPGEKDYQTKRQLQVRQLDDLKEQIRWFYYEVLQPVEDPHEFDAYRYQGETPSIHVRDPKQVAKEKAAIAQGFTPERFEKWAQTRQLRFTPYQRSALRNLMAWHEIQSDHFSAEMNALALGVGVSLLFWEVGGGAGKAVLGPLERQGLKLLGRFAPKGAGALEEFGASTLGKYVQRGAHQGATIGAGQSVGTQILSGQSAERIAGEKNRLLGVVKEMGTLGQGALTHGVLGYFLGAGTAGTAAAVRAALSPAERATIAAIERYQLKKQARLTAAVPAGQPPVRGQRVGGIGLFVKPEGDLDPMLLDQWLKAAKSPEFARDIKKYNQWMRPLHNVFLGQVKASKSAEEVIRALENGLVEVRVVSKNGKAAVFKMTDKETGETYYHLQGDPHKDPTGQALRHELLHLGAMLNGQVERPWYLFPFDIPHEMAVSWSTTPKIAAATTAGLGVIGAGGVAGGMAVKEWHDLKRQTREAERTPTPLPVRKPKSQAGQKGSPAGTAPARTPPFR